MNDQEREVLSKELTELSVKVKKAAFINPKDMRRMDEIRSLLFSNGEQSNLVFKVTKGREVRKGLNTKGYHDKGGKTGL